MKQASAVKENRAFSTDLDLNVVWPTETEASRITEHKGDPDSPMRRPRRSCGTLSSSNLEAP